MRFIAPIFAFVFIALSVSGCSVNPATGKNSFTGLMSEEQELQVGKEEHPKILAQFGGAYDHAAMSQYVDDLGQRLAKVSELPDLKWTFTVLDDPIINAFALPGGYIYISRGLIGLAENEAELAAVLGHEIGHVTARHSAQRYSQSVLTGVGATILGIVVGGPAGDLANFAGQAYVAGYSRSHEMEADMLGMRYMTKLGYDPNASASFFKKLAEHTEVSALMRGQKGQQQHYSIFASHPDTQSRIIKSEEIAQAYPSNLNFKNRRVYLAQIDGLDYGTSIHQGVIDGQTFIHPDMRLSFTFPEEFKITNHPRYVLGSHPNGSDIQFNTVPNKYGDMRMDEYLQGVWGKKFNLQENQIIQISGMEAATGWTVMKVKNQKRTLRLLAIKDDEQKTILRSIITTPPELTDAMDEDIRRYGYSFRKLSYREAKRIKGRHIALHRVGRGDTISSLANRMHVDKLKTDWFKVLNKETLKDGLQSGETVKLVVK
ncbi:M48 family metalloprotease [Terasakiella sp. A23]|uniref:M48 family metalloprotease n=1 Tax=Terasakiella sp. FCG-A23 TaxID=3080561 RepID=UPI0029559CC3|nr:M48 family metalloprotease [Terasakiella sp. A23]MDV7337988.1 M48 family metalloprotease [Terasakiella sp. A23]